MEPLDSNNYLTSKTNVMNVENIDCKTPSPLTSCTESNVSITGTNVVSTVETAVEERNDAKLELMDRLIPVSIEPENSLANETEIMNVSSNHFAALKQRIRRERDLYLRLQGLTNRIEKKVEGEIATANPSKTKNSMLERQRHSQSSNARIRRRERSNSGSQSAMSQYKKSSDSTPFYSSGFSSPEPELTLREIRENYTKGVTNSSQTASHFSRDLRIDRKFSSGTTDTENFDFKKTDYLKDGLMNCNLSSDRDNTCVRSVIPATISSQGMNYPYVTQKRIPKKFGGYRPSSGINFRSLSSDSESGTVSDRKVFHHQKYRNKTGLEIADDAEEYELQNCDFVKNSCFDPGRENDVKLLFIEKTEILKDEILSPLQSVDTCHFVNQINSDRGIQRHLESEVLEESKSQLIANLSKQKILVDDKSFSDSYSNDIPRNLVTEKSKLFQGISFPEKSQKDILPSLSSNFHSLYAGNSMRNTETLVLRAEKHPSNYESENINLSVSKPDTQRSRLMNRQSFPASVRSLPENIESLKDLRIENENPADNVEYPNIPRLEINSQDYSQSHSSSGEMKGNETPGSSLDVDALIKALSEVSLKQKKSIKCINSLMTELKSPIEQRNRFSGSSEPRSSEYTPAADGSRQSLTSLEVSGTYSLKIGKDEETIRRENKNLIKCDGQKADLKKSKLKKLSSTRPLLRQVDEQNLETNLSRGNSSFIPIVAKVNKTNLVCKMNSLKIKSSGKLISPRKYQDVNIKGEIVDSLTTRTDVSRSSDASRKSFRSLKSTQVITKVDKNKIDNLQERIESKKLPAVLSGRRILEPLNSIPKIQPDLPIKINRKLERRKKITKELSEIINSESETISGRTTTAISSNNSSQKSPSSQNNKTDLKFSRLGQPIENSTVQRKRSVINKNRVSNLRPSTEENHKNLKNSTNRKGTKSLSLSPKAKDLIRIDNESKHQQKSLNTNGKTISDGMDLGEEDIRSSDFATNSLAISFRNCVHLNDLQDGKEVTLTCGIANCEKSNLVEKELFNRLPSEISGSLTRHSSSGVYTVKQNLHLINETPNTIEELRKKLQESNDRWITDSKSDHDSTNDFRDSEDGDISSIGSPIQYRKCQSRNSLTKLPKIHQEISLGKSDDKCSSSLYKFGYRKQEFENNDQTDKLDSQRSSFKQSGESRQDTFRSIAKSIDSTADYTFHDTPNDHEITGRDSTHEITKASKEDEIVNDESDDVKPYDIQVNSNTMKDTLAQGNNPESQFRVDSSYLQSKLENLRNLIKKEVKEEEEQEEEEESCDKENGMINEFEDREHSKCPARFPRSKLENLRNLIKKEEKEEEEEESCDKENQMINELEDRENSKCPKRLNDYKYEISEKTSSPKRTKSANSHTIRQRQFDEDGIISSQLSTKSFLSMSKLNSSGDIKWDTTITTGGNIVKKSQDRFPFTISESASKKVSKFQEVADVSLDELLQDENTYVEHKDTSLLQTQNPANYNGDKKFNCEESSARQTTPFINELPIKIPNDSADDWDSRIPFNSLNYMSYGCREEPKTLMPTVKGIVKKISSKFRHTKTKRRLDPEETQVEILYKNKKCRYESCEDSSSEVSFYQSELLDIKNKLVPSIVQGSNNGSIASSEKTKIMPKRKHECISMSIQHSPRKVCDENDLWIQEFDSDVEFDCNESTVTYCHMHSDLKTIKIMPRTSSPVNDRYSIFLAKRKPPGINNESSKIVEPILNCCEIGDSEKVYSNKTRSDKVDKLLIEIPEMVSTDLQCPKTPGNSFTNNNSKVQINTRNDNLEDSITDSSSCCCFSISQFFIGSKKHSSKQQSSQRIKVRKICE